MGFKEDMSRHFERFGRKTSAMLVEARLRSGINSLENEIESLYAVIGMTMYSMWKRHDVDTGKLVKHFETINRKLEEIEEKKKMILLARVKGTGEEAEEKVEEKPVRPLLPDYGGKINGEAVLSEKEPEESAAEPLSDAQHIASLDARHIVSSDAQHSISSGAQHSISSGAQHSVLSDAQHSVSPDTQHSVSLAVQHSASLDAQHSVSSDAQHIASPGGVVIEEEDDGVLLPESTESGQPDDEEHIYCPGCGTECPAGANYCRRCGVKLG